MLLYIKNLYERGKRHIHQQLLNSESWSSILFYVKEEQYSLLLWDFLLYTKILNLHEILLVISKHL